MPAVLHLAANGCAVVVERRKLLAELEILAPLTTRPEARAAENSVAPRAAQLGARRTAEQDRRGAFLEHGHAELGAALTLDVAPRERRQDDVLASDLARAVRALGGVQERSALRVPTFPTISAFSCANAAIGTKSSAASFKAASR